MTFADRLEEILRARGKNKSDLARHLGIEPQSVGQWGKGAKPTHPRAARLSIIAEFLEVTVPELMSPPGTPFSDAKSADSAQSQENASPDDGKLVEGTDQIKIAHAWESLPEEDKDILKAFINVMLNRRGIPPIG